MTKSFNARSGLILVEAEISGPLGKAGATLVLDTGATCTSLNVSLLRSIGYDPSSATGMARMTTGSAVEKVPRLIVNRVSVLGMHAIGLQVLAHILPPEAAVDGLLGLDIFHDGMMNTVRRTSTTHKPEEERIVPQLDTPKSN